MGDSATAMRDPVFYRWHAFVDDVFQEHKNTLPQYTVQQVRNNTRIHRIIKNHDLLFLFVRTKANLCSQRYIQYIFRSLQLDFPGVEIADVKVMTDRQQNVLNTFWTKSDVDLSRGLDFTPRGAVLARFTHLNHADFTYKIVVNNRNNGILNGTVRIFIGPKEDERGLPFTFRQQKNFMIEMDKFTTIRTLLYIVNFIFIMILSASNRIYYSLNSRYRFLKIFC